MAENSKIEWTDHTFNPWVGCTKVSPACDHCYAESWAKRSGSPELWQGERRRTTEANWRKPIKWNAEAEKLGIRYKVFCCSLADVFDNEVPTLWRYDLFKLIDDTPHLDWLLLTKRIGNVEKMGGGGWRSCDNVWLGATVVNQTEVERDVPKLVKQKWPAKLFLSIEPMLEPITFRWASWWPFEGAGHLDGLRQLDWVIVGGESGPSARYMRPEWARELRDQCDSAGVSFFFKQMTRKEQIPDDLMVRQFPTQAAE